MKNCKFLILFLLLPLIVEAGGGSPFTKYGIGDIFYTTSARRLALGGLGTALSDQNYISTLNPAGWYKLGVTRLELGINFDRVGATDNSASAVYSNADFSGFRFGFPVYEPSGIALVFGLVPVSKSNYNLKNDVVSPIQNYSLTNSGNGSLNKAFFGLTYKLPQDFILGGSFEYYSGSFTRSSKLDFGIGPVYSNAEFIKKYNTHALGFTLGTNSPDLSEPLGLENISNFHLGAAINYVSSLKTDTIASTKSEYGLFEVDRGGLMIEIPSRVSFGASFNWGKDYLILLDYLFQPWSDYKYKSTASKFLKDAGKVSLGIEHKQETDINSSFWEQIILRGGLSYESTQYNINGTGVNQFSISGGFTVPLSLDSSIDIGIMYGIRGSNSTISENIVKLSATFSFGELWFVRRER